jgi:hypothetical protein
VKQFRGRMNSRDLERVNLNGKSLSKKLTSLNFCLKFAGNSNYATKLQENIPLLIFEFTLRTSIKK